MWDAMFADDWQGSLRERLRAFRPEVIGLSVRNVDDQEIRQPCFFLDEVKDMVDLCRDESSATVVAGGAGFSMFAGEALSYVGADFGIVGEGERAFDRLLSRLEGNADPTDVPGLVWREGAQTRLNPPERIEHLDELPTPERVRLDALRYHETRGDANIPNTATVQAKRGCTESCLYCSTPAMEGSALRLRSPEAVVGEIEDLADRGMQRFQFVDALFTNPAWHAEAICEQIVRRGLPIHWSCTLNPAFANPELLRLMKQAGCGMAIVGNESGCTRTLDRLRKGFDTEAVERCFSTLEAEGMRYNAFLLLGGPGEGRDSVRESVELMERYSPNQVSVTVGVRIYPHCELVRVAEEDGLLPRGESLLAPRFYLAPTLQDWIWEYLEPVMQRHPNWTY